MYETVTNRASATPRFISLSGYPATTISPLLSYIRVRLRVRASSRVKISNAHSLLGVGDARSPGHHRARGRERRRRERKRSEMGESKRTLARQDTRERTSNLVASECYISPERPCCFFNARTTFTPWRTGEERMRSTRRRRGLRRSSRRTDRFNDDRCSLLVLCPLTRRRRFEKARRFERGRESIYRFAIKRRDMMLILRMR